VKSKPVDMAKVLLSNANNESQSIHVESDILAPATSNTTPAGQTIFNIRRKGVISSGSAVHITIRATDQYQRLPVASGAMGLIRRAEIRTSKGVVICQSDEIGQLMTLRNKWSAPELREKKGVYLNGSYECFESLADGRLRIKGDYDGTDGDKPLQYRLPNPEIEPMLSDASQRTMQLQIKISQLFPEALAHELPVYLIDGNLQLVLTWSDYKVRGVASTGDPTNVDSTNHIEITDVQYVSDHIFYDGKTMAALQGETEKATGLVIPYIDFNEVEFNLQAGDVGALKEHRKFMGLSNLRLKYILLQTQEDGSEPTTDNMINGVFNSKGSWHGDGGGDRINMIINNRQWYPVDWARDNLLYRGLEEVYGKPLALPKQTYTSFGGVVDDCLVTAGGGTLNQLSVNNLLLTHTYYNTAQRTSLTANSHYMGICFETAPGPIPNTGKKIGFTPVEFKYTRIGTTENNKNLTLRAWCAIERILTIRNGQVMVNYS